MHSTKMSVFQSDMLLKEKLGGKDPVRDALAIYGEDDKLEIASSAAVSEQENSQFASEARIEKALNALLADWRRQDQTLDRSQFERVVHRRKLEADEIVEVLQQLRAHGVVLEGLDDDEEIVTLSPEDARRSGDDFVVGYFRAKLLTREEEVRFGRAVQIGIVAQHEEQAGHYADDLGKLIAEGEKARAKMVVANLRLVFSVARKFGSKAIEFPDHIQNGTIGLMRAIEGFDPELGLKFATYATWWIRQSISRANDNDSNLIRMPVHRLEQIRRVRRHTRRLTMENNRGPTLGELCDALDMPREKVAYLQRLSLFRTTSLDAPLGDEDDIHLRDIIPSDAPTPEDLTEIWSRNKLLKQLIEELSPREQMILDRRFGLTTRSGRTLQELGNEIGVTRERIRQIEDKALKKLYRKALRYMRALED
ncbi:RNA polymerase primary sigma factor [Pseudochrobactrum saccharolyticum]|uniref:RNA polymerase primary sigma factor n=1 Tax=Pseudochrobactrum saccharolyticum TaxID=354352 RepID=A0A7W8ANU3_9HYPH|nr:sigma-70 family RNA polymerase sigma factor [Pseudochrobactrum saccharolyticum]MBB5092605.1 RNA polymerase primary sigma factor [Pseudochrobactrum saccharolyticum]